MLSSRNISICDGMGADIDAGSNPYGIITSPNYPQWQASQDCKRRIVAPAGKYINVYITDIGIEEPSVNDTYVELFT